MKKRSYYYIEGKDPANPSQLKYKQRKIDCEDTFEDELIMLAFPMGLLKEISSVLTHFNFNLVDSRSNWRFVFVFSAQFRLDFRLLRPQEIQAQVFPRTGHVLCCSGRCLLPNRLGGFGACRAACQLELVLNAMALFASSIRLWRVRFDRVVSCKVLRLYLGCARCCFGCSLKL